MMSDHDIQEHITHLRTSNDYEVRIKAARALGKSKSTNALEPLFEALHDLDEDVRVEVIKALARLGDKVTPGRIGDLLSDPEPKVRIEVIKVLYSLASFEHIPEIYLKLKDPLGGLICPRGLRPWRSSLRISPRIPTRSWSCSVKPLSRH